MEITWTKTNRIVVPLSRRHCVSSPFGSASLHLSSPPRSTLLLYTFFYFFGLTSLTNVQISKVTLLHFRQLFASSPLFTHLQCRGLFRVTFLLAQKSNQKSALKNYVLKNLLNVPLQKSRGTCASRNVTTFDMVRFSSRKVVSFDTDYMALWWLR